MDGVKLLCILSAAVFCKSPHQEIRHRGKDSDEKDIEFEHHVKDITYAYENRLIDFKKFKELVSMLYSKKKQEDKNDEGIKEQS